MPYANTGAHFDGARLFVNTWESEGFPNTFLQAWSRGIPTVSFFNPVIDQSAESPVARASSPPDLARLVAELVTDDEGWNAGGQASWAILQQHHSLEAVAAAYEACFRRVQAGAGQRD